MRSYLDLLTIIENAEGTGTDVISIIADIMKLKREEVEERMAKLSVEDSQKVADAASRNDTAEVLLRLDSSSLDEALDKLPPQPSIPQGADREDENGNIVSGGKQVGKPDLEPEKEEPKGGQGYGNRPSIQPPKKPNTPSKPEAKKTPGTITKTSGTKGTTGTTGTISEEGKIFSPGDKVSVDGKDGVVGGIDDGPGETVGILFDGRLEMVKKSKVKAIEESVIGMTSMPAMRDMINLATSTVEPTISAILDNDCEEECSDSPKDQIMQALDVIDRCMPELKISEFGEVRRRLEKCQFIIMERAMNRRPKI